MAQQGQYGEERGNRRAAVSGVIRSFDTIGSSDINEGSWRHNPLVSTGGFPHLW